MSLMSLSDRVEKLEQQSGAGRWFYISAYGSETRDDAIARFKARSPERFAELEREGVRWLVVNTGFSREGGPKRG